MLAKSEPKTTDKDIFRHSKRMATCLRALIEGGEYERASLIAKTYMLVGFNALAGATSENDAKIFAGRLAFRGDESGQSDFSPVNFPTMG